METFLWILAVLVIGGGAVAAAGYFGGLPKTITDSPKPNIPDGVLTAQNIRDTRFSIDFRGYNVEQVDELLERIAWQLAQPPNPVATPASFSFKPEFLE